MHRGDCAKTEASERDGPILREVTAEEEQGEENTGQLGLVDSVSELHDASVVEIDEVCKDFALNMILHLFT